LLVARGNELEGRLLLVLVGLHLDQSGVAMVLAAALGGRAEQYVCLVADGGLWDARGRLSGGAALLRLRHLRSGKRGTRLAGPTDGVTGRGGRSYETPCFMITRRRIGAPGQRSTLDRCNARRALPLLQLHVVLAHEVDVSRVPAP
jgi:hypothetical protein